jgi:hypothetical protein
LPDVDEVEKGGEDVFDNEPDHLNCAPKGEMALFYQQQDVGQIGRCSGVKCLGSGF